MPNSCSVSLTFADYLAANRTAYRMNLRRKTLIAFSAVVVGLVISNAQSGFPTSAMELVALGIAGALGWACAWFGLSWIVPQWVLPFSARKTFDQLRLDGVAAEYVWDAHGMKVASPLGTTNLTWSHFTGWRETELLLLLQRTPMLFFTLPKAQIPEPDIASLRAALIAGEVPSR